MKRIKGLNLVLCALVGVSGAACASQEGEPKVSSSASQPSYAVAFPGELEATSQRLSATQSVAQTSTKDFATFPDKLKTTDYEYVKGIYEAADEEGRSESYAEGFANAQAVDGFFTRNKAPLTSRVAGANKQAAEKANCTSAEFYGATSYSLERGVAQSLEDEAKDRSDAQNSIEQHKRKLGERDAETLSTQAQQISMASYAVFVGLPTQRSRTERLLSQVSDVESTLEERAEELDKIDSNGFNYEEKKWLADEKEAVSKARAQLAQAKEAGEKSLKDIEAQSEALEKDYTKAFDELIDAVEARQKAAQK